MSRRTRIEYVEGSPEISRSVKRGTLISAFESCSESCVLLLAPSGYGKSYLARQMMDSGSYGLSVWVDTSADECGDSLLAAVESAISTACGTECVHSASRSAGDTRASMIDQIQTWSGEAVALVLDDVQLDDKTVEELARLTKLVAATSPASRVITTSRSRVDSAIVQLGDSLIVDIEDLRMSVEEAVSLSQLVGSDASIVECEQMLNASGGQAALLSVLLRHRDSTVRRGLVPTDIRVRLVSLAERGLPAEVAPLLYAASLMRRGTCRELSAILETDTTVRLREVAEAIPLLSVSRSSGGESFVLHEYACQAYGSVDFAARNVASGSSVLSRTLSFLHASHRDARLFRILLAQDDPVRMAQWLSRAGGRLVDSGHLQLLDAAIESVPVRMLVSHPELVHLQASALRERGRLDEAYERANVAVELAEYAEARDSLVDALGLLARVEIDLGELRSAVGHLRQAIELTPRSAGARSRSIAHAYLTVCHGHLGELAEAREAHSSAMESGGRAGVDPATRAYAMHAGTIIPGLLLGDWASTVAVNRAVFMDERLPIASRLLARNNECFSLSMMGRIEESTQLLDTALGRSEELGLGGVQVALRGGQALAAAAAGDYTRAESLATLPVDEMEADASSKAAQSIYRAQWLRASGRDVVALASVEDTLRHLAGKDDLVMVGLLVRIEEAACRLASGDVVASQRLARKVADALTGLRAAYHRLVADLVLAEIARREGRTQEAIARLLEHADYVLTESANLVCAFYIRAFPGLLGILASAVGPSRLPSHMLRLITGSDADEALRVAWDEIPGSEWGELAERLVGAEDADALRDELEGGVPCTVRLFGGLEVDTPDGRIPDRAWRKRKARLLFAMLVAKRGQDVPRELLLDHLWPEMSDEKARNNFYVIWNTLKGALSPNLPKGENCPFVESVGGLCRVNADAVRSDLDVFEESLSKAREAEEADDADRAIAAYRELEEVYRGDLLPGDVYDDWFGSLRDRYRQQFGDAMIQAAQLLEQAGQPDAMAQALRKGLDQDPLREDLYQGLLRCQIVAGQRSAAIETYMSCRSRLSEELGLDPSSDTRLLYDQVLAMEEGESGLVSSC